MSLDQALNPIQIPLDKLYDDKQYQHLVSDRTFFLADSESQNSHNALLVTLAQQSFDRMSCHFGIGNILTNLKIMAQTRQPYGIIADCNPAQIDLARDVITLLASDKSASKNGFVNGLESLLENHFYSDSRCHHSVEETRGELFYRYGWLYNDNAYDHLRNMAREGNLTTTFIDFFDAERVSDIAASLSAHGLRIGTLYLTNLTWFLYGRGYYAHGDNGLTSADITDFWDNIYRLCDDGTVVCDAQQECFELDYTSNGCPHEDLFHYIGYGSCAERRASHLNLLEKFRVESYPSIQIAQPERALTQKILRRQFG